MMRVSAVNSIRIRKTANRCIQALVLSVCAGFVFACSSNPAGPAAKRNRAPSILFAADTALSVGNAPWSLAIGDFSGDTIPDIAVACIGGKTVSILTNGPDGGIFHRQASVATDTVFRFDSGFRPRSIATADVNADGAPDLVIALAQDSVSSGLDRIVVLLNRGIVNSKPVYSIGADYIGGKDIRDLFIGDLDAGDGGVEIVAASSSQGVPPVVLSRHARVSEAIDSTINLVGFTPESGALNVGLRDPITFWFDTEVKTIEALARPDSHWVEVVGTIDGGSNRAIAVQANKQPLPLRIGNSSYTQYTLTPVTAYRPHERVTVTLTARIQSRESNQRRTITLPEAISWSFDVEGTRLAGSYPGEGAIHVPTTADVSLNFNYWLDPASIADALTMVGTDGAISLSHTYTGDATSGRITVHPSRGYAPYENIRLIVGPTLRDSTGRQTFAGDTLSFQATGPRVISTSPKNGSTSRVDGGVISLDFNTPMSMDKADGLVVFGDQSGAHPATAISSTDGGLTARVTVGGRFIAGETVTAVATEAFVSTTSEYPLARPYVWRFSVQPSSAATLASKTPGAGSSFTGGTLTGGVFTVADGRSALLSDPNGTLGFFSGGGGAWSQMTTNVAGTSGRKVTRAGDLNEDGLLDLIVANSDSDFVEVFFNTSGTGSEPRFDPALRLNVGTHPVGLFLGDLNGDGHLDIATANQSTNDISILLNLGGKAFGAETFVMVGNHPQAIDGADLDGDGDIDLVVANALDNTITLVRNLSGLRPPPAASAKRAGAGR